MSGVFEDLPHVFSDMVFEAELSYADGSIRQFDERYLNLHFPRTYSLEFNSSKGSVTIQTLRSTGLSCDASTGLFLGPEEEPLSSFDMYDDSEFIMALTDNTEGDCSSPPVQVRFHVEKVE